MVEIAVAAQDKFGVEIPDDQLKDLKTVQDVIDYVTRRGSIGLTWPRPQRCGAAGGRPGPERRSRKECGDRPDQRRRHRLGATTPVGADVPSTWESLLAGRSGVRSADRGLGTRICRRGSPRWAAVDPATVIDRVQARRLDRCEQFALVAAREAWADAGSPEVPPERLGVVVSSGIGGVASTLNAYDTLKEKGWSRLSPFTVPMLMPNGSAGWISIELGARAGRAHHGERVRVRCRGDRLRDRDDQVGPGRRGASPAAPRPRSSR